MRECFPLLLIRSEMEFFTSLCSFLCIATLRMAGAIGKSTEVMKAMQNLIRVPEISQSMMELSKEMAKVHVAEYAR